MKNIDFPLLFTTILLILFGLLVLHSAQPPLDGEGTGIKFRSGIFARQTIWLIPAILAGAFAFLIPFRTYNALSYLLFGMTLLLLFIPLLSSPVSVHARRWINMGPLQFQPSELVKITLVLALARRVSDVQFTRKGLKSLIIPFLMVLVPTGLILMEPDLGTSLIFFFILLSILFYRKARPFLLLFLISPIISLLSAFHWISWTLFIAFFLLFLYLFYKSPFSYSYSQFSVGQGLLLLVLNCAIGIATPLLWNSLKEYQKKRILTFLNPNLDPQGAGWHTLQSKIAIGSGGIAGVGYGEGTQKNLAFLPERG